MDFKWFENGIGISYRIQPLSKSSRVAGVSYRNEPDGGQPGKHPAAGIQSYRKSHDSTQGQKPALIAKQIMSSPVVTLTAQTLLDDAWELIRNRRFRHLPVVDGQNRLIGIISDRDILQKASYICRPPDTPSETAGPEPVTIDTIMKRQVLTATPRTEIRRIARLLFEERIGSMPIVDNRDRLEGIITRSDILRILIREAPIELWI